MVEEIRRNVINSYGNFDNFDTYENRIALFAMIDIRRKLDLVNGIEIIDGTTYR